MKKRKDWRMKKETRFDSSKKLGKKRKGIDLIDQKLLLLLNERLHIALEIGKIKEEMGKKIYDFKREQEVLERLKGKNKGPLKEEDLKKIFTTIMKVCQKSQI
jgi:chorismate mutase/prephenate dehydratase